MLYNSIKKISDSSAEFSVPLKFDLKAGFSKIRGQLATSLTWVLINEHMGTSMIDHNTD